MKNAVHSNAPVRNLTTGEAEDPLTESGTDPDTGKLYCSCGTWNIDGLTCPNCNTSYERIEGDMAKTSKKKASTKTSEKLPRAIAKSDLLTGEKVDLKKSKPKTEEKRPKDVKTVPVTRHLKRALTREEVEGRSDEAAHCREDIQTEEANLATVKSQFKARIEEKTGRMDRLLGEVRSKCTYEDIDCQEIWDGNEKIVKVVRLDTGEEVERRDMTRAELQLPLPQAKPPVADGTEKMTCHGKVAPETTKKLKESAVERLNDDGDLTASELRARKRKQEQLLNAVDEAENTCGVPVEGGPSPDGDEDGEFVDYEEDESEDGIIDA